MPPRGATRPRWRGRVVGRRGRRFASARSIGDAVAPSQPPIRRVSDAFPSTSGRLRYRRFRYRTSENTMFKAIWLEKDDAGFRAALRSVDEAGLPEGDVLVAVEHSTLNFKDGLAITNRSPIIRSWPMIAGIDGAGTVLESSHAAWKAGDRVV